MIDLYSWTYLFFLGSLTILSPRLCMGSGGFLVPPDLTQQQQNILLHNPGFSSSCCFFWSFFCNAVVDGVFFFLQQPQQQSDIRPQHGLQHLKQFIRLRQERKHPCSVDFAPLAFLVSCLSEWKEKMEYSEIFTQQIFQKISFKENTRKLCHDYRGEKKIINQNYE